MQRTNHQDHDYVTLAFRALGKHAKLVHAAADKKGVSAADYMRHVVLEWAASDLGVPIPDLTAPASASAMIAQAAKARGVSTREFMQQAAREVALRDTTPPPAPRSYVEPKNGAQHGPRAHKESGMRRAVRG